MTGTIALRQPFSFSGNLRPTTIGFDNLFDRLTEFVDAAGREPSKYPPYNIEAVSDYAYVIEVALAGFTREDIEITLDNGILTVSRKSETKKEEDRKFLHRGISQRDFVLNFKLAPDIRVNSAHMQHGILRMDLEQIIPEERKPKKIEISVK